MTYKVSIVIPLYNKEDYIERTIKSILNQSEQNFEIVIIDDGSTDNSINIINKMTDQRIKLYKQNHGGVSRARNYGVLKAQSDFISFLDADDEWENNYLETILYLRLKYPNAGLYMTDYKYKDNNEIKIRKNKKKINLETDLLITNYFEMILNGTIKMSPSCISLPKKVFEEEKGFNVDSAWGEDQDLWGRIALRYPIAYSPKILSIGDRTGNWRKRQNERIRKTEQHPFIISGKKALQQNLSNKLTQDVTEIIALYQLKSANLNFQIGNFEIAKKILFECNTKKFRGQKLYLLSWIRLSKILSPKRVTDTYYLVNNIISRILEKLSALTSLGLYM
jgi:glycosyltransferase involved in cell wall biosynthesis